MIVDYISNIGRYKGISYNLDTAIEYLIKTDLTMLPLGQTQVDKDNVFINVMEATAKPRNMLDFEVHKRYMDIQIDIIGTEIVDIGYGDIKELAPLDESKDIGFYHLDTYTPCTLGAGRFIVCMNGEPHRPSVMSSDQTTLRKCVVKVAV